MSDYCGLDLPSASSWWRHQMETFSALLTICAGNSPVPGEFPAQRPVTRSFDVSLICARINGWVDNSEAGDLRRHRVHYDVIVMYTTGTVTQRSRWLEDAMRIWHHCNIKLTCTWPTGYNTVFFVPNAAQALQLANKCHIWGVVYENKLWYRCAHFFTPIWCHKKE